MSNGIKPLLTYNSCICSPPAPSGIRESSRRGHTGACHGVCGEAHRGPREYFAGVLVDPVIRQEIFGRPTEDSPTMPKKGGGDDEMATEEKAGAEPREDLPLKERSTVVTSHQRNAAP